MDETTVTIIGMIAAFITASVTAFFAEPVKNYIQHRTKLHKLRMALYKEIVSNYVFLSRFYDDRPKLVESEPVVAPDIVVAVTGLTVRTECYKSALESYLIEFYELSETSAINSLYGTLRYLVQLPKTKLLRTGKNISLDEIPNMSKELADVFRETLIVRAHEGRLNKRILRKLMTKNGYDELVTKGNELAKKNSEKDAAK